MSHWPKVIQPETGGAGFQTLTSFSDKAVGLVKFKSIFVKHLERCLAHSKREVKCSLNKLIK